MRKATFLSTLAILAASVGSAAMAVPPSDRPLNAQQLRGTGCVVPDANGDIYDDDLCDYQYTYQLTADGSFHFIQYRDRGNLPEDAVHPSNTIRETYEATIEDVPVTCAYVVTPSGVQTSYCHS